ncbi:MAG: dimethyl sulfoxide reductase anchor subunit [Anaerolineae bacterium]|nr:dimethyl sulfoxide reductase anchor subunit [Anaerolineae bacterium]
MIHPNNEWSLIIFNVFGQMSVGAFLFFGVAHFYAARKAGIRQANLLATRALLALGPILVIGMAAVFGHVGNPDRVFNMLSNLDTSWLAREVAAYGAFLVVGGAFAILQGLTLFKKDEELPLSAWLPKIRIALAWIAAIFGVLFVLSAAMIYFDPRLASRQTGWAHFHTVVIFFVDMVMLGALALGVGFVGNYLWLQRSSAVKDETREIQLDLLRDSIKAMAFVAIAAIGVLFVTTPLYLVYLGTEGGTLTSSILEMLRTDFSTWFVLYLFLSFTGAGILSGFAWFLVSTNVERQSVVYLLVVGAFICAIVAAFIGRYLFYARNATLLMGGP